MNICTLCGRTAADTYRVGDQQACSNCCCDLATFALRLIPGVAERVGTCNRAIGYHHSEAEANALRRRAYGEGFESGLIPPRGYQRLAEAHP